MTATSEDATSVETKQTKIFTASLPTSRCQESSYSSNRLNSVPTCFLHGFTLFITHSNACYESNTHQTELSMATTRLLWTSRPIGAAVSSSRSSSSIKSSTTIRCVTSNKGQSMRQENVISEENVRKATPEVLTKASVASSEHLTTAKPQVSPRVPDPASLVVYVRHVLLVLLKTAVKTKFWNLHFQMLIERVVVDCRFFTLLAVLGSLIGSILCFVEGCFLILQSYVQYFYTLSPRLDQGHLVPLLIEAIDIFLVGATMIIFGVSLYMIFVEPNIKTKANEHWISESNLSRLFHIKSASAWIGMQSIEQAKSRIGHAVVLILHVGLLEKFRIIPLATGFDLACFAAAILISSASIYLLSKLNS